MLRVRAFVWSAFGVLLLVSLIAMFPASNALPPIFKEGVFIFDSDANELSGEYPLVDLGASHIYVVRIGSLKVDINYTYDTENGSKSKVINAFAGDYVRLPYYRDASLVVADSSSGSVLIDVVLRPATWDNKLKYRVGVDAPTPHLARINNALAVLIGVPFGAVFSFVAVLPRWRDKVRRLG